MLRFTLVFVSLILIAVCLLPSRRASTSATIQRLTNTSEQTLNLNPTLSDNGNVVVFESTADLATTGAGQSFHSLRANVSGDESGFEEFARSRLSTSSLSTDGSKVVFASTQDLVGENSDRNSEIYLADGAELKQLTHTTPSNELSRLSDGNFEPTITA